MNFADAEAVDQTSHADQPDAYVIPGFNWVAFVLTCALCAVVLALVTMSRKGM